MRKYLIAACVAASLPACSGVRADEWTGPDKVKHAYAGAGIGAIGTLVTKDAFQGCMLSIAAGVGKEVYTYAKDKFPMSYKDVVVTAAAGCAAAYSTEWLVIVPNPGGATVVWTKRF